MNKQPTICAGLIVKNEERDLPRCLESLKGVVDGIYVVDTGSTDRTEEIVREANFPYKGFEVFTYASEKDASGDWKLWDFSRARNRFVSAIEKQGFDYILWMDADDELLTTDLRALTLDSDTDIHGIQIESGMTFVHHRLWKTKRGVRFKGKCHEYPDFGKCVHKVHNHIKIKHHGEAGLGESSLQRNLRILQREMQESPSPRCAFYLANTYRELDQLPEALQAYQKRLSYTVSDLDEYYFATLYGGRCAERLGLFAEARSLYMRGATERPGWSEFWMALASLERSQNNLRHALGYAFLALERPIPSTFLWREEVAYKEHPAALISEIYGMLE